MSSFVPSPGSISHDVHEVGEAENPTFPCLEGLPIRPVDGPECRVFEPDVVWSDACQPGCAKDLLEMQALSGINDVQHQVVPLFHPLVESRQIRRGVKVRAI